MSGPKADRLKLLKACQMNLSPIFGLYPDEETPSGAARTGHSGDNAAGGDRSFGGRPPDVAGVESRRDRDRSARLLRDKPVFIADGHHRYETAINYRDGLTASGKLAGPDSPPNFVMMMFVGMSDPGLRILPTHRLVSGLTSLTKDRFDKRPRPALCPRTGRAGGGRSRAQHGT